MVSVLRLGEKRSAHITMQKSLKGAFTKLVKGTLSSF